jgi:hypothetical protein
MDDDSRNTAEHHTKEAQIMPEAIANCPYCKKECRSEEGYIYCTHCGYRSDIDAHNALCARLEKADKDAARVIELEKQNTQHATDIEGLLFNVKNLRMALEASPGGMSIVCREYANRIVELEAEVARLKVTLSTLQMNLKMLANIKYDKPTTKGDPA